jgi:SAM-dependent methyltransferase
MDISDVKDNLMKYLNLSVKNIDNEFEAIFTKKNEITSDKFNNVISYLLNEKNSDDINKYNLISDNKNNVSLDIRIEKTQYLSKNLKSLLKYRLTIDNNNDIMNYCKTNKYNSNNVVYGEKRKLEKPIDLKEYNLRFNINFDKILTNKDEDLTEIMNKFDKNIIKANKIFRYKKRISFMPKSKLFRIDLTLVKSGYSTFFHNSGILNSEPEYEIEIELNNKYIHDEKLDKKNSNEIKDLVEDIIKELIDISEKIILILNNEKYIVKITDKIDVLTNYIKLVFIDNGTDSSKRALYKKNLNSISYFKYKPFRFFVGYKQVSLELSNFVENSRNSVLNNYTVTEKADGERYLLYINKNNKVYLINNKLDIKYTGLKHDATNTLIDGELITKNKWNENEYIYLAFDIYFKNGNKIFNKPLKDKKKTSRLQILNDLITGFQVVGSSSVNNLKIEAKVFHDNVKTGAKKILDRTNYPYNIDGLIYTPTNLPIGALNELDDGKIMGTWIKNYKWKPPEQSTIDFLVKFQDKLYYTENTIKKLYMYCILYVGFNEIVPLTKKKDGEIVIDIYKILKKDFGNNSYGLKEFAKCYIEINQDNRILTSDNNDIKNNMIVEFYYDNESNIKEELLKWKPYRLRIDKSNPNDYSNAQNVWNTIQKPVTKKVLYGDEVVKQQMSTKNIIENEVYYAREVDRNESLLKPLLDFHNYWVKNKFLYNRFKGAPSLYDMACGPGGDIYKWVDSGYSTIIGSDLSIDNIYNTESGIYQRYTKLIRDNKITNQNMLFFQLDATKLWNKPYRNTIKDPDLQKFSKIVFGDIDKIDIEEDESELIKFHNLANKQFNLVSCMFAIHYMFENESTLDNFVNNLDLILKPGGFFFGTSLDGSKVNNKFKINENNLKLLGNSKSNKIKGEIDGRLLWSIEKLYDTYNDNEPFKNIGKKIKVYMETINQELDEYLVDYNLLEQKLKARNILPLNDEDLKKFQLDTLNTSSGSFQMIYDYYTNKKKTINLDIVNKEISFLNKWFIFRKYKE